MRFSRLACAIAACCSVAAFAQPLSTSFTYQGELASVGLPAQGLHDFQFQLFDAAVGGAQVGPSLCADNVTVVDGRFVVSLDFGSVFAGAQRFLAVSVRADTGQSCAVIVGFTQLSGRQALTVAPNAAFSLMSGNATQLNGQPGTFYTNASNITAGTLPDSRLSTNIAQLSVGGTYTGIPNFNGGTSGISSPFQVDSTTRVNNLNADLLDGFEATAFATASHTHDAGAIISGLLADSRLSTNIPRLNAANTFTATTRFNAFAAFNRSAPLTGAEVFGIQNAPGSGGYVGMYINSTETDGQPFYGYRVGLASAWTDLDNQGVWSVNNGGRRLSVLSNGNVGVNTITPTGRFHILDASNLPSPLTESSAAPFKITNGSGVGILFDSNQIESVGGPLNLNFRSPGQDIVMAAGGGRVGIGTSSPAALLDLLASDPQLRVRNVNDPGGAVLINTWGSMQLGLFNPGANAWNTVPAGGYRAMFAVDSTGRVGSVTNTSGAPAWRNTLDDGSGNATISGTINATNLPAVKASQTFRDPRAAGSGLVVGSGSFRDLETISVNVPAAGYLVITATANVFTSDHSPDVNSAEAWFKLEDTSTGSPVQLVEVGKKVIGYFNSDRVGTSEVMTISWTIPANGPGTRSFKTAITISNEFNNLGATVYTTTLNVAYYPRGL